MKENKISTLNVRVEENLKNELNEMASGLGIPVSRLVRQILEEYTAKHSGR